MLFATWISRAIIEWNDQPLPFIWNFAKSLSICSQKILHNSSRFIEFSLIAVCDWNRFFSNVLSPVARLTFSIIVFRIILLWFVVSFFQEPFLISSINESGSYVVFSDSLISHWFANPLKADLYSFKAKFLVLIWKQIYKFLSNTVPRTLTGIFATKIDYH